MDIDRLISVLIFLVISRRARHLYIVSQVLFSSAPLAALHHKYFETMHKVENPVPSTSISLERILAVPRIESAIPCSQVLTASNGSKRYSLTRYNGVTLYHTRWESNQRFPVFKSCIEPTQLQRLGSTWTTV